MKQDFGAVCFLETEDVILIFLKIFQTLKDMLVRLKSGTDVGGDPDWGDHWSAYGTVPYGRRIFEKEYCQRIFLMLK